MTIMTLWTKQVGWLSPEVEECVGACKISVASMDWFPMKPVKFLSDFEKNLQ